MSNDVIIDKGALKLAINVLERSGKNEIVEEIKKSARDINDKPDLAAIRENFTAPFQVGDMAYKGGCGCFVVDSNGESMTTSMTLGAAEELCSLLNWAIDNIGDV